MRNKKGLWGCIGSIVIILAFIAGLATGAIYSAEILQQILALKERGETLITILNWINDRQKCEIMAHIDRKAHTIIPDVEDSLIADELYSDILQMALREAGVNNMDSINTKYLASIHEAIDAYQIPECLREQTTIPR